MIGALLCALGLHAWGPWRRRGNQWVYRVCERRTDAGYCAARQTVHAAR